MTKQVQDQSVLGSKSVASKKRFVRPLTIGGIGIGVVCAATIGIVLYVLWSNSPVQVLAVSLQNTLALQKLTFQVVSKDQITNTNGLSTKFNGQYDKSIGYAITENVAAQTAHYKVNVDLDYVVDLASTTVFYRPNKTAVTPRTELDRQVSDTVRQVLQQAFKPEWVKLQADKGKEDNYACVAAALQMLQGKPELGRKLLTTLAATRAVTVQVASSDGDTVVFALQSKNDQADDLVKAYMDADVYKNYIACAAPAENAAAALSDAVKQFDVRVFVDKQAKHIKEIALLDKQARGAEVLRLTITPAQNVTVAVPKNVTGTTSLSGIPFAQ